MADIQISEDAFTIAAEKAHAAGRSLRDWLTHAITLAAEQQEPIEEILFDDCGFPSHV